MTLHPSFSTAAARSGRLLLAASLILLGYSTSALAAEVRPGFKETRIATGLVNPVSFILDASGRALVCEKAGKVRVIKNGALLATPFLTVPVDTAGERGLLSILLDTDFSAQHYVYVFYTAKTPTIHNRVSRFTVNPNADTVVAGSELVLLDLPTATNNFNNGGAFARYQELFISTGDDGVPANAQSLNSPFGKILRINYQGTPGSIPTDNPFYNQTTGINRAIWARGFRNPYPMTMSGDEAGPHAITHDTSTVIEKNIVSLITGGQNFGWPVCDGSCPNSGFTNPVFEWEADSFNCPVKGAAIYYSSLFGNDCGCGPVYKDSYFYTGCDSIRVFPIAGSADFASGIDQPSGLATDDQGSLWYLEGGTGSLYRITLDTPCVAPPAITVQPQAQTVLPGTRVTLSVQATSSPGCDLRYQWYHQVSDGDVEPIAGAFSSTYTFTATSRAFDNVYSVGVSNAVGSETSSDARVTVLQNRFFEAETLTVLNSSGDTISVINEAAASGGAASLINTNAVNDQITYLLPGVDAATYTVKVRFKKASNRGKVQLLTGKVGGTLANTGAAVDLYSASSSYQEVTIGTWTAASTSDKQFSFKVTGKNASSTGFSMCIDSISLVLQ